MTNSKRRGRVRPAPAARAAPRPRSRASRSTRSISPWGRWNSIEWPSSSSHSTRRSPNCGRARRSVAAARVGRRAQDQQRRVGEEHEPPARAQQPRGLRDPALRLAPQARAVLREREVEARVGQRDRLGVALDERELEAVLGLHARGRWRAARATGRCRPAARRGGRARPRSRRCRSRARSCRARRRRAARRPRPPGCSRCPSRLRPRPSRAARSRRSSAACSPVAAVDLLVAHRRQRPALRVAGGERLGTRLRSIRLRAHRLGGRVRRGAIVRTRAPRARSASDSASAGGVARPQLSAAATRAVGLRHRTSMPRRAGRGVEVRRAPHAAVDVLAPADLAPARRPTAPRTTRAPPARRSPRGAPGAPNTTRLPLRAVDGGDPQPPVEARARAARRAAPGRRSERSARRRGAAPRRARRRRRARSPASASGANGVAAARRAGRPRGRRRRAVAPRRRAARRRAVGAPPAAHSSRRAPRAPESGSRPAASDAATIEPADVPTKYSQSRKSMPGARPRRRRAARASTPRRACRRRRGRGRRGGAAARHGPGSRRPATGLRNRSRAPVGDRGTPARPRTRYGARASAATRSRTR